MPNRICGLVIAIPMNQQFWESTAESTLRSLCAMASGLVGFRDDTQAIRHLLKMSMPDPPPPPELPVAHSGDVLLDSLADMRGSADDTNPGDSAEYFSSSQASESSAGSTAWELPAGSAAAKQDEVLIRAFEACGGANLNLFADVGEQQALLTNLDPAPKAYSRHLGLVLSLQQDDLSIELRLTCLPPKLMPSNTSPSLYICLKVESSSDSDPVAICLEELGAHLDDSPRSLTLSIEETPIDVSIDWTQED